MARLEDIPKKEFFRVPDGYFEDLPGQIQARISRSEARSPARFVVRYALQYVLPVLLLAAVLFFYKPSRPQAATILASVKVEDLIEYLHESGLTTEEIVESLEFTDRELEAIENQAYDFGLQDMENEPVN